MYGEHGKIPYEKIDCEIRNLVRLINEFDGIRTISSCVGHSPYEETEIVFLSESQEAIYHFITALPFWGIQSGFVNNQPQTKIIWANITPQTNRLIFTLHIGGTPNYIQRILLSEVEKSLTKALASSQDKH